MCIWWHFTGGKKGRRKQDLNYFKRHFPQGETGGRAEIKLCTESEHLPYFFFSCQTSRVPSGSLEHQPQSWYTWQCWRWEPIAGSLTCTVWQRRRLLVHPVMKRISGLYRVIKTTWQCWQWEPITGSLTCTVWQRRRLLLHPVTKRISSGLYYLLNHFNLY